MKITYILTNIVTMLDSVMKWVNFDNNNTVHYSIKQTKLNEIATAPRYLDGV